jgi:protein tyrosine/serine phosphatase
VDVLSRDLAWEGCFNARDVGGYPTADGRRVRWGALLRSDLICRLTARGREQLLDAGVSAIVDLRSEHELAAEPGPYATNTAHGSMPLYLNTPLLDYDDQETMARLAATRTFGEDYCVMVDGFRRRFAAAVAAIANAPEGGVLVHCHAGKDRTGIVVALVLSLIGVPKETIVEDYAVSADRLWPLWEEQQRRAIPGLPPLSPPEAMAELLDYLERAHGGAEAYLRSGGLTDDDVARLRARLIDPD